MDGDLRGREGQPGLRRRACGSPRRRSQALRDFVVSIKGPLGTPVGGGIRSLNVAIRQSLDLYACVRPIRHFSGVSTPMKDSSQVEMVVFRENTEDIYAGIEWPAGSPEVHKLIAFLQRELVGHRHPLPRELRHRHQTRVERGIAAPDPQGDPVTPSRTIAYR